MAVPHPGTSHPLQPGPTHAKVVFTHFSTSDPDVVLIGGANNERTTMVTIELDRTYPVSAGTVWARISDFYDLSWLPAVAETRKLADTDSGSTAMVNQQLKASSAMRRCETPGCCAMARRNAGASAA